MAATRVFLDTDVLINWLAKETEPGTRRALWKAPYQILKKIEAGKFTGCTTLLNLMEIIFVLRRKKRWGERDIVSAISKLQRIPNLTVLVPTEADVIVAYNLQSTFLLGPFDALYYAMMRTTADFLVSRDRDLLAAVNQAERREVALTPEDLLQRVKN